MKKTGIAIFDMDDTLVKREDIYVHAQKVLLQTLKEHGADIDIDQGFRALRDIDYKLASLHGGKYMYDYKELARALWFHFIEGKNVEEAVKLAFYEGKNGINFKPVVEAAEKHNMILEKTVPPLGEDALIVLKALEKRYVLILLSIGKKAFQMPVITHYQFDRIFDKIIISPRKNERVFEKARKIGLKILSEKYNGSLERIVVIGDRISQDIAPGKKIGAETVWIPGPYYPGTPEEAKPNHVISSLSELLDILL